MEPFFRQILDRTGRGERLATAMVVDSRGSTPQRIGARMLFFADGSSWGTVGGGCVESDVRVGAMRTLATAVREISRLISSTTCVGKGTCAAARSTC